ncbi:MAG: hypothetical protein WCV85_02580 [Patescibacteria group bacterium]
MPRKSPEHYAECADYAQADVGTTFTEGQITPVNGHDAYDGNHRNKYDEGSQTNSAFHCFKHAVSGPSYNV